MDINYELYKVFYHVASTLSFLRGLKQLFISQSAVSQSIKTLERKLDQVLFIRSTKKVQLTPEGEILLRYVEPAMNLIQRGRVPVGGVRLHRRADPHRRERHYLRYFLVPYIKQFHEAFPGAHIKVTTPPPFTVWSFSSQGRWISSWSTLQRLSGERLFRQADQAVPGCVPGKHDLRPAAGAPALLCRASGIPDPHAGPQEHHERIPPQSVPAAPSGSGAGSGAEQQ